MSPHPAVPCIPPGWVLYCSNRQLDTNFGAHICHLLVDFARARDRGWKQLLRPTCSFVWPPLSISKCHLIWTVFLGVSIYKSQLPYFGFQLPRRLDVQPEPAFVVQHCVRYNHQLQKMVGRFNDHYVPSSNTATQPASTPPLQEEAETCMPRPSQNQADAVIVQKCKRGHKMKASGSKHKRGAGVASPHESVAFLPSGPHACLPCVRCHLIRATALLAFGSLCLPLSCYLIRDFMSRSPPPRTPSALLISFSVPLFQFPCPSPLLAHFPFAVCPSLCPASLSSSLSLIRFRCCIPGPFTLHLLVPTFPHPFFLHRLVLGLTRFFLPPDQSFGGCGKNLQSA